VEALPVGEGFVPSTVEVAPSNPDRIYVTGAIENEPAIVLRSDDRGHNWQRFAFDGYGSLPLFISAIDPLNPDLLYARIDNQADTARPTTQRQLSDHLLVSRDAGETWQTVFSLDGDLYGFALSPDGSRIATGGPGLGLYLANTRDLDFQPAPAPVRGLRCLRWTEEGLLACGQETLDGWTVGLSRDEGQSFEPRWHVQDLSPLECSAASTTGAVCPAVWPDIARTIDAEAGDESPRNVSPPPAPAKGDGGCSIRPAPAPSADWLPLAAALGWLAGRRRRSQGTSM
jgi:MYXO-CTERM domain-containing protein